MSTTFLPEDVTCPFMKKIGFCIPESESDFKNTACPKITAELCFFFSKCLAETNGASQGHFSTDTPEMAHFNQAVINCKI